MPAFSPIVEVRNLMRTQRRFVLVLACKHFVSLSERELTASPSLTQLLDTAKTWWCLACPDPEPPSARATQLWREAGEP